MDRLEEEEPVTGWTLAGALGCFTVALIAALEIDKRVKEKLGR